MSIARTAFINIYGRAAPDDERAKTAVAQILAAMLYGQDGYFFVFDYKGNNLVSPRQTHLIGKNWTGLEDVNGTAITDTLIRIARQGGGYHTYDWPKPSTGETARMVTYVVGLQDWRWAIGTGIFIDDVLETVAASRAEVESRVRRTSQYILAIAVGALLMVFMSGLVINIRERRLADVKLKALTQRVFDAQEEERGRVARELHDGISQLLVGCAMHSIAPNAALPKAMTRPKRRSTAASAIFQTPFRKCAVFPATYAPVCWMISALARPQALTDEFANARVSKHSYYRGVPQPSRQ